MTRPEYVLDASFLIKFHREQPRDLYPTLWERIANLLATGEAILPREAAREIDHKDDQLRAWLRAQSAAVVEATVDELAIVQAIGRRYPDWVRGPRNAADPFVIAAALSREAVVVTAERQSGVGGGERNLRLPTVAREFGVESILPTELVRRCGWTF